MPIGPIEFLILLFCCGGVFFIPVVLLVIVLLRRSGTARPTGDSYGQGEARFAGPPHASRYGVGGGAFALDSNDRILAALGYVIWIVALVVLLLDETKRKPLLKDHAVQAIAFALASFAFEMAAGVVYTFASLISFGILGLVLWPIFFVPLILGIYYGYLAYTADGLVEIPWLTEFLSRQGMLETRLVD